MPLVPSVKVMWDMPDGSQHGVVVETYESDTDESIINRAWQRVTAWVHPSLWPSNKSEMKIRRGKQK